MLILGVTADDKGAQLESLIQTMLTRERYSEIRANKVGAGGNEIDVSAVHTYEILGQSKSTPVICEAKAYRSAVDMPTWQKFLGKLFIARKVDQTTIGVLVALNGVNGNVWGSFESLEESALFLFDGRDLSAHGRETGELVDELEVGLRVIEQFNQKPLGLEIAYYGGGFLWITRWNEDEYSVVDGLGSMMSVEEVEALRPALEASASGRLIASAEAEAKAEAFHAVRASLLNELFQGRSVFLSDGDDDVRAAASSLRDEPFCSSDGDILSIREANSLDAPAVAKLFTTMFEQRVAVRYLSFMIRGSHRGYVDRLIDALPELNPGFTLDEQSVVTLRSIAGYFPSVWIRLATPLEHVAAHAPDPSDFRATVDEATQAVDRSIFWEEVEEAVLADFRNVFLRGFLFDYMGIAEIEQNITLTVKSRTSVVGTVETRSRTGLGRLSDELTGEAGTRHILVRLLADIGEPWEVYPGPFEPLDDGESLFKEEA